MNISRKNIKASLLMGLREEIGKFVVLGLDDEDIEEVICLLFYAMICSLDITKKDKMDKFDELFKKLKKQLK